MRLGSKCKRAVGSDYQDRADGAVIFMTGTTVATVQFENGWTADFSLRRSGRWIRVGVRDKGDENSCWDVVEPVSEAVSV